MARTPAPLARAAAMYLVSPARWRTRNPHHARHEDDRQRMRVFASPGPSGAGDRDREQDRGNAQKTSIVRMIRC